MLSKVINKTLKVDELLFLMLCYIRVNLKSVRNDLHLTSFNYVFITRRINSFNYFINSI